MIIGIVNVLNEIDFIDLALQSMRPIADRLIVAEFCVDRTYPFLWGGGWVTAEGLSADGTTEWLQEHQKEYGYTHYPLGLTHTSTEATFLQLAFLHANLGDYLWIGSGSEIYFPDAGREIRNIVDQGRVHTLRCHLTTLWRDTSHRISGGAWDLPVERIIRYQEGYYVPHPLYHSIHPQGVVDHSFQEVPQAFIKTAYARSSERVMLKFAWQEIEYQDRLSHLGAYRNLTDYIYRTNSWWTEWYDHINQVKVLPFGGPYPPGVEERISQLSDKPLGETEQDTSWIAL